MSGDFGVGLEVVMLVEGDDGGGVVYCKSNVGCE